MSGRQLSSVDRLLGVVDNALRSAGTTRSAAARPSPAGNIHEVDLPEKERRHSAGLMRVNHAGEVAAQALYQGHAALARDPAVAKHMLDAAGEERDHLAWCEQRLSELGESPSRLSPLWYAGAFAIGASSGVFGDRWSLGFVAETERQVADHLRDHLEQLPEKDQRSRAIVRQMRDEEAAHGAQAEERGAARLPVAVRKLMRASAQVMKRSAYWL